jgi:hypothetical protein
MQVSCVADRLMDEKGRDGTVDAAGQRADDALVADLLADGLRIMARAR